ncbi:MAG TPA: hypothetical protein ENI68_11285 [Gammaproteobacteria bacterium]|nr:hypothetical protein [Gammaproteobacteria bacterium]
MNLALSVPVKGARRAGGVAQFGLACRKLDSESCVSTHDLLESVHRQKFFAYAPEKTPAMLDVIERSRGGAGRLNLFYLWGIHCKGVPDEFDERGLEFLENFRAYVASHFSCDAQLHMVLCDVHARINEVPENLISSYASGIERLASRNGWAVEYMSQLWEENGLNLDGLAKAVVDNEKTIRVPCDDLLLRFANRYYLGADPRQGLMRYFLARLWEKPILEQQFREHIHVTAADARLDFLQPEMPTFWVWTLHRGRSAKPWFRNTGE